MKKIICGCLGLLMLISLCACGFTETPKTNEELAIETVEEYGKTVYALYEMKNNELKSSKFTITTVQCESETVFIVYGKAAVKDVYDKNWNNEFSCRVELNSEENNWEVKDLTYRYSSWT